MTGANRETARRAFLDAHGWGEAAISPLAGDASTRIYFRLARNGERAVLMDAPPGPDGPPLASGKPYSAVAHIAEDMRPFAAVARHLSSLGLSAPELLAQDLDQGFLLLEDLGDAVYGPEIDAGRNEAELYGAAVDVLAHLHGHAAPEPLACGDDGPAHTVPPFDDDAVLIEAGLLPQWYARLALGAEMGGSALDAFEAAWREVIPAARADTEALLLRDYHSPNLLWLPEREGVERVGVIDFQDALIGPAAYDVVSLLQDARRTVAPEIETELLAHYVAARAGAGNFEEDAFRTAYAVMGAQRNTKIIGIFARLWLRDGKPRYLAHIPRLADYLARDLSHPALAPVAAWYEAHLPLDRLREPIAPEDTGA